MLNRTPRWYIMRKRKNLFHNFLELCQLAELWKIHLNSAECIVWILQETDFPLSIKPEEKSQSRIFVKALFPIVTESGIKCHWLSIMRHFIEYYITIFWKINRVWKLLDIYSIPHRLNTILGAPDENDIQY